MPMTLEKIERYIFTGAPGSGKTSVICALAELGYVTIQEAATDLIATEQADGIIHPWEAPNFVDKIIAIQKERQITALGALQFYDRSPFCTYALGKYLADCRQSDFLPSAILLQEIERCLKLGIYQQKIFFFENLGVIQHTKARKISYEEACIFEQIHVEVYKQFDFDITLVPKDSIKKRCQFVLDFMT